MTRKPSPERTLTVRELLGHEVMDGAELVAGADGLDRPVHALNVMTVPEIDRWVKADEFLLATGYPLPRDEAATVDLLTTLHAHGLAGIGVKLDSYVPHLSDAVVAAAEDRGFPLIVIPERIRFDDILSQAFSTIVNRQAAALARAQEIHHSFLRVTLSGGGIDRLAQELSELLRGAPVVIADRAGAPLATVGDLDALSRLGIVRDSFLDVSRLTVGLHEDGDSETRWAVGAVRAGTLHHGFVVAAEGEVNFGEFALIAVDQAAIVAALEITRDLAVGAVERQFASNALHELMTSAELDVHESAARGLGLGWDLERPVAVLVCKREVEPADRRLSKRQARLADQRAIEFWTSAVRTRDLSAAAAGLGTELVAVLGADGDAVAAARSIQAEVSAITKRKYAIGVSRTHDGPVGIPRAYHEARAAVRLGHRVTGSASVTAYDELGLFRLLAQVGEDELRAFAEDTLQSLLALQDPERDDLLQTLEALFEHNLNIAEASRHLHYHYNTLRYRLAKLERLLGPFSTHSATALRVGVALQILQMRGLALGASADAR